MCVATILEFKARSEINRRLKKYLDDPSLIAREGDRAISTIARAFKGAGAEERKRLFLVLSTLAQDELSWILLSLLEDPEAEEELKDQATIYLNVIGAFVSNPASLTRRLNELLHVSSDKDTRLRAIVAMGWEGNTMAIPILVELLHHSDPEIQEVAVIGMSNLGDGRLFGILKDRLRGAPPQQKMAIYYNLWRFEGKEEEALSIYMDALEVEDPWLRADILAIMADMDGLSPSSSDCVIDILKNALYDQAHEVRLSALQALLNLGELSPGDARRLIGDPCMEIKRIALDALEKRRRND